METKTVFSAYINAQSITIIITAIVQMAQANGVQMVAPGTFFLGLRDYENAIYYFNKINTFSQGMSFSFMLRKKETIKAPTDLCSQWSDSLKHVM